MGSSSSQPLTININRGAVEEYEIGTYRELKARSRPNDGLDIHHLIQEKIGLMCIPGYSPQNGICVALRATEHRKIPTLDANAIKQKYTGQHPRYILADNILRDHSARVMPVRVLIEALRQHVRHFSDVYALPNGSQTKVDSRLDTLIVMLEKQPTDQKELQLKAQWALTKGNQLSRVPTYIRKCLRDYHENNGTRSEYMTTSDDHDERDVSSYVIHKEYDRTLGRTLTCSARREFVREETRTERRGRTIVTIITRYYRLVIEWS